MPKKKKSSAFEKCKAYIKDLGHFGEEEAEQIASDVVRLAKSRTRDMSSLGEKVAERLRIKASVIKMQSRKNIEKRGMLIEYFKGQGEVEGSKIDPPWARKMKAKLQGIFFGHVKGGNLSTIGKQQANRVRYIKAQFDTIPADIQKRFQRDGDFQAEVMAKLVEPEASVVKGIDGMPILREGVEWTISGDAQMMASVIRKSQDSLLAALNSHGAAIGRNKRYGASQKHNSLRILEAGLKGIGRKTRVLFGKADRDAAFKNWSNFIRPLLDESVFPAGRDPEEFLRGVFDNIIDGEVPGHSSLKSYSGSSSSITSSLGQSRVLYFKSAAAQIEYHNKFGTGTISENIMDDLIGKADTLALLEDWGTDPRAMIASLVDYGKRKGLIKREDFRKTDIAVGVGEFSHIGKGFWSMGNTLDAMLKVDAVPSNIAVANVARGLRLWSNMTLLGKVLLSSIPDVSTAMNTAYFNGASRWAAIYKTLYARFPQGSTKTPEQIQFMRSISIAMDGLMGSLHGSFTQRFIGLDNNGVGLLTKGSNFIYRVGLTDLWTRAGQDAAAWVLAQNLAEQMARGWSKGSPRLKRTLERYNIFENEWNAIIEHGSLKLEGLDYAVLSPDLLRRNGAGDLADKLMVYYLREGAQAIPTVSPRERGLQLQGTRPGTLWGEVARAIAHLKSFVTLQTTTSLARYYTDGGIPGSAQSLVLLTLAGGVSLVAKEAVEGRYYDFDEISADPAKWSKFILRAAGAGGGLGYFADLALSDYSRYGNSPFSEIQGPMFGTAESLMSLAWQGGKEVLRGGDAPGAFKKQLAKFGLDNLPFNNLFFTQFAMNKYIYSAIMMATDPNYKYDRRERLEEESRYEMEFLR